MTDACGVPGNHMVFYKTGKILVTASEKGNSKNSSIPPKFDFFKSVLIDIIEAMSKSIKGHIESTEREETGIKVPVVPQDRETPVNNFPVMIKNVIPQVIKSNPKELAALIEKCKPNASIKEIRVMSKGDIRVVGQTPHDYAILQQPWPKTDYGDLTPALPDSNTVDQAVLVFGVPLSIDIGEIEDHLNNRALFPKEIVRFKKPQSIEPSTTVKVVFGSSQLKERILSEGFNVYHHIYKVVSYEKDPVIQQCFRCQSYGHSFFECTEPVEKCMRCAGKHRIQACTHAHADAKCANCEGNHSSNYRGCPVYKAAVLEARRASRQNNNNNNNNNNINNNVNVHNNANNNVNHNNNDLSRPRNSIPNVITNPSSSNNNNTGESLKAEDLLEVMTSCMQKLLSLIKDTLLQGKPLEESICKDICIESVANLRLRKNSMENDRPKWNEVAAQNPNQRLWESPRLAPLPPTGQKTPSAPSLPRVIWLENSQIPALPSLNMDQPLMAENSQDQDLR